MASSPAWTARLANEVAQHLCAVDILSPLGCHVYHNVAIDQWEISLFASRTSIVGGRFDGQERCSAFHLDLGGLLDVFQRVTQSTWQTHSLGDDDELGPHVAVEGVFEGHDVWVRILAQPPRRFGSGRNFHAYDGRVEDTW